MSVFIESRVDHPVRSGLAVGGAPRAHDLIERVASAAAATAAALAPVLALAGGLTLLALDTEAGSLAGSLLPRRDSARMSRLPAPANTRFGTNVSNAGA
ncbi:hypothetical protein ACFRFH_12370 [Leifsonia sp. NPDC056824]|uniref:hypothetical protein n=1 Tax=Leifsonia sp. NPDC056824 TaxID=3345953 RepID=UPI0036C25AF4